MKNIIVALIVILASFSCGTEKQESNTSSAIRPGTDLAHFSPVAPACLAPRTRDKSTRCSFYRECLEGSITCEDTAFPYAISYGEKYCNKFVTLKSAMSSEKGQEWVDGTMLCLQEAIALTTGSTNTYVLAGLPTDSVGTPMEGASPLATSCEVVRKVEFGIHPICYIGGPARFSGIKHNSVCSLSISDTINIIRVVDASDVMTKEAAVQMVAVARQCIVDIKKRASGAFSFSSTMLLAFNMATDENQQLLDLWAQKETQWSAIAKGGPITGGTSGGGGRLVFQTPGTYRTNPAIYYVSASRHYCTYPSIEFYRAIGSPAYTETSLNPSHHLTNDGECQFQAGHFRVGDIIYYSNGVGHYCKIKNFEDYVAKGSPAFWQSPALPANMKFDGNCN